MQRRKLVLGEPKETAEPDACENLPNRRPDGAQNKLPAGVTELSFQGHQLRERARGHDGDE